MSEIIWPLENVETTIYENISEKLISFRDFLKSSGVIYHKIPIGFSTLYRSCILTYDEWFDLVLGFKKIDAKERSQLVWDKCFEN